MKKTTRILVLLLAVMMAFTGCGNDKEKSTDKFVFNGYPVKSDEVISYWVSLNSAISNSYSNWGDTPFAKHLKEKTGINVSYIHPSVGQEQQSLSMSIASGNLPDIVEYTWITYNGGPQKNLDQKVIIPLNDLIDEYAPNFKAYLKEHPEVKKDISTNDGVIYGFPFIAEDPILTVPSGLMFRKDWLDDLNMKVPTNLEEFYNVLKAFKEKKNAKIPFSFSSGEFWSLMSRMGTSSSFGIDKDGKVHFGPAEPEYKAAVTWMNKMFDEGLLDANFLSTDSTILDGNMLNGYAGATFSSGGGGMGKWIDLSKGKGSFDLVAAPPMKISATEPGFVATVSSAKKATALSISAAITTKCKNPALAVALLDYAYSDEGKMLYNFGVEGETYKLVDGKPVYTDLIMNNPDGLSVSEAMGAYIRASNRGPFVQSVDYINQYYAKDQQRDALEVWSCKRTNKNDYRCTPYSSLISVNSEDKDKFDSLMAEITPYVDKMRSAFIMGKESLNNYDDFLAQLDKMGVKELIQIKQRAYDKYNSKK